MENKNKRNTKDAQADIDRDVRGDHRYQRDRRRERHHGYTYVSMVGWIDRREKNRRKGDSNTF